MINMTWLKTFCVLGDIGHFTRTAEALFMTQSGVSQHIKKLEEQLSTPLLIREGKSFSLTDAGVKLHRQGKTLLYASQDLATAIRQDEKHSGQLRISSPGSVGLRLYPHLLGIQQRFKELTIDYTFAPNSQIEQDLIERRIDIGLVTEQTQLAELTSIQLAQEPLVLITPSNVSTVNWNVLIELGFINHPDGVHHARQLLSENFPQFSHIEQFPARGFSNQIGLILEPVSRGLGFTVLPITAAKAFHRQSAITIHQLKYTVSESLYLCKNSKSFESQRVQFIESAIVDFVALEVTK